jgi:hypothetical protein
VIWFFLFGLVSFLVFPILDESEKRLNELSEEISSTKIILGKLVEDEQFKGSLYDYLGEEVRSYEAWSEYEESRKKKPVGEWNFRLPLSGFSYIHMYFLNSS